MKQTVVVLDGKIINVGDWDYQIKLDDQENEVVANPLPEGAVIEEREITLSTDNRIVDLTDPLAYRDFRRGEYPDLRDQLDAIWKGGTDLDDMRLKVLSVKEKYPKTE